MKRLFILLIGGLLLPGNQAWADVVYADDVIIQSSACVGFDCVNNESFGFDTIRLKENNTRIKFEDTSTGTFPSVDWQLTANESSSGGANKFSIEDITNSKVPFTIEASTRSNQLYVDSTSKVGFGTSTPILDLHVKQGNTPALRLEQDGSSGYSAQTWDVAGNEANFFVRDVTSGSRLPFRIQPGAATNSIYINSSGNVGFGTSSPDSQITIVDQDNLAFSLFEYNDVDGVNIRGKRARGTITTPTAVQTDDRIITLTAFGHTGTAFSSAQRGGIAIHASENWSSTANGTYIVLQTATTGTSSVVERARFDDFGLKVTGDISVDGTTLTVPDYVFDTDYPLMPLNELALYIAKEKHLPEIPPALAVQKKGLNLGSMQINLLKKIEELTLYTIQQNQQFKNLAFENAELRSRLSAIEATLYRN